MAIAAMEIKEAAHRGVLGGGKEAWVVGRSLLYRWHPS